jgi:serine phosphatase RsbU (regulator of sigma subunit)
MPNFCTGCPTLIRDEVGQISEHPGRLWVETSSTHRLIGDAGHFVSFTMGPVSSQRESRKQRSDAALNRAHIVASASELLSRAPRATMSDVARAAHVSRGTLYRHFPTRSDLLAAVTEQARAAAETTSEDRLRPAGELARAAPTPLSVADVLNKVPPHLLGEQVVAEAQRIPGVSSAAIYLVDLEGTHLTRLAGPLSFPERLPLTLAVGTEIPQEGLPALHAAIGESLSGASSAPLLLRGRALGALVAVGSAADGLADLAYEAAAALALADAYTDHLDAARRVRATSPAAEIQQNLLPPRLVRTNGALIAGNVLPGYEIGGDWFDYAENPGGTWIGTADAEGSGPRAAALAAVALGAFRSARHQGLDLPGVVRLIDATVREVEPEMTLTLTIGFWVPPTSTFSWISCGELGPIVVDARGDGDLLEGHRHPALGGEQVLGDLVVRTRTLADGDRLVLVSDGVVDRTFPEGRALEIDGVVDAIRDAPFASAAGAVSAIEAVLRSMSDDELVDDATIAVLTPVLRPSEGP